MYKFHLLLIALLCTFSSFSQTPRLGLSFFVSNPSVPDLDPLADNSAVIDILQENNKSYAAGIVLKYQTKAAPTIRFRFMYTSIKLDGQNDKKIEELSRQSFFSQATSMYQQKTLTFSPGISWSTQVKSLNFIYGFELPFTSYGSADLVQKTSQLSEQSGGFGDIRVSSQTNIDARIPSGYALGLGSIAGIAYQFTAHFSAGSEFLFKFDYRNKGGNVSINSENNQLITIIENGMLTTEDTTERIRITDISLKQRGFYFDQFNVFFYLNYWF